MFKIQWLVKLKKPVATNRGSLENEPFWDHEASCLSKAVFSQETHLALKGYHHSRLSHVPHVHRHLEAFAKGLGVEKKDDLGLEQPADGGLHLRAHHHHALHTGMVATQNPTSVSHVTEFHDIRKVNPNRVRLL